MRGVAVHHRCIRPAGGPFLGHRFLDRLLVALQQIDLERPGGGGNHALGFEILRLLGVVVPVLLDDLALAAQKVDRGIELLLAQLIGIGDAEFRIMRLQI